MLLPFNFTKIFLRSLLLSLLTIAGLHLSAQSTFPIIYNAGNYGCADGTYSFVRNDAPAIEGTAHDSIYWGECYTDTVFDFQLSDVNVVAGGTYTLYLHFAEIYHGAGNPHTGGGIGSRVFDLDIEGIRILQDFDIIAAVGPGRALVYRLDVTVDGDGMIDFKVTPKVGDAKVSAVEIHNQGAASDFTPTDPIIDLSNANFPVEYGHLEASLLPGTRQVALSWSTLREQNNAGFSVEFSQDGTLFEPMTFITGAGTTEGAQDYRFVTAPLTPGEHFFRLQQVDLDGQYEYSQTLAVSVEAGTDSYTLSQPHPNPTATEARATLTVTNAQRVQVHLTDLSGRRLRQVFAGQVMAQMPLDLRIDASQLSAGLYLLLIEGQTFRSTQRVQVQ